MDDGKEEVILLEQQMESLWNGTHGYCNGLLILYRGLCKVVVWNPSTRHYRNLPGAPFKSPDNANTYTIMGLGLCCDSTDEHKAVFIVRSTQEQFKREIQVWIFSLTSNIWRRVQDFPYFEYEMLSFNAGFGYFVDDCLHWLCVPVINDHDHDHDHVYDDDVSSILQSIIVAFDVGKETFSLVLQPEYPIEGFVTDLHVLGGCLCISSMSCCIPQADLFIRKKAGGDEFTWIKLYSIEEFLFYGDFDIFWFKSVKVLGYSKRGDKIILDFGSDEMVWYDIEAESFGKFDIEMAPNCYDPIVCVESLVPVGGGA